MSVPQTELPYVKEMTSASSMHDASSWRIPQTSALGQPRGIGWGGSGEGGCWITTERGRREAKDRARSKPLAAATVASAHPTYFTDRCRSAGALWDSPASKTPHSPPRTRASCPTCSPSALPCQIPPANENSRILSSAPPGNPGAWPGCSPWGCPM